ncbi:MAG: hypothetical protein D6715_14550 [Calditrichaeota bacterium]|nr:MAG: hypothetical protein D6715_14550 [Calditrichota bacterium]
MVRLLVFIALPLLVARLLDPWLGLENPLPGSDAMVALGFTTICGYLAGRLLGHFSLPRITGYLLAGIVFGPHLMNFLSTTVVEELQLIDRIALSLIALTAGGELRLSQLRSQMKTLGGMLAGLILICLLGFMLLLMLVAPFTPGLEALPLVQQLGVAALMGVVAISASPATTIAVITETRARGPFTSLTLSLTVVLDIVVVLLFALVLGLARGFFHPTGALQLGTLLQAVQEIFFSLGVGTLLGYGIALYLKAIQRDVFLFIMGSILLSMEVSHLLHLELILVFIAAGFWVENFTPLGERLIEEIERYSLPVYVIFFAIAGASLNLPLLAGVWLLTVVLVSGRFAFHWLGTWLGGRLSAAPRLHRRFSWMALSGQAGITLGLAILIEQALGEPTGRLVKNLLIGGVAANQILGPVLYRWALVRAGEVSELPD